MRRVKIKVLLLMLMSTIFFSCDNSSSISEVNNPDEILTLKEFNEIKADTIFYKVYENSDFDILLINPNTNEVENILTNSIGLNKSLLILVLVFFTLFLIASIGD